MNREELCLREITALTILEQRERTRRPEVAARLRTQIAARVTHGPAIYDWADVRSEALASGRLTEDDIATARAELLDELGDPRIDVHMPSFDLIFGAVLLAACIPAALAAWWVLQKLELFGIDVMRLVK